MKRRNVNGDLDIGLSGLERGSIYLASGELVGTR
jgi:hypothetical protein